MQFIIRKLVEMPVVKIKLIHATLLATGCSLVSDLCNIVLTKPYFQENNFFLYFSGS